MKNSKTKSMKFSRSKSPGFLYLSQDENLWWNFKSFLDIMSLKIKAFARRLYDYMGNFLVIF